MDQLTERTLTDAPAERLLGLRGPAMTTIILVNVAAWVVYTLVHAGEAQPLSSLVTLVAVGTAAIGVFVFTPGDPLPWWAALAVVLAGMVAAVSMAIGVRAYPWIPMQAWWLGTSAGLLALVAARGLRWWMFGGYAAIALTFGCAVWFRDPEYLGLAVYWLVLSVPLLVMATVFVLILRPLVGEIREYRLRREVEASDEAALRAVAEVRDRRLREVERLAGAMLERIAEGTSLTDAEQERCRLLEARLRDGLRARALDSDEVADAVWRARERGVDVVLMDDGELVTEVGEVVDEAAAAVLASVRSAVVEVVDAARDGRVTARVSPAGRTRAATVVALSAAGEVLRRDVYRNG